MAFRFDEYKLIAYATVTVDGHIQWAEGEKERLLREIHKSFPGCIIELSISKVKDHRTAQQNRYYWGSVVPFVQNCLIDLGWDEIDTKQKTHEWLKQQFLTEECVNTQTGEIIQLGGSTKLDKQAFTEYLENIARFAAEQWGVALPPITHRPT